MLSLLAKPAPVSTGFGFANVFNTQFLSGKQAAIINQDMTGHIR
jgi:hypothetical protein